jgi:nucleoside-diphosphate-sugar epimerase
VDALITGSTGLVGRHLVTALKSRGDSVSALALPSDDTTWLEKRDVTIYRGDVRDYESLRAPVRRVDTVFHLAALQGQWVPWDDYYRVNVIGTENVCRAAIVADARLVHVSSWTIYGTGRAGELGEEATPAPGHDPYWITKAQGDELVQRMIVGHGLRAAIIRPGTIFGVGDRLNFGRIADRIRNGRAVVIGSGHNALPLVYVTDVVKGLLLCADRDQAEGQAFNISNDRPLTQGEFLSAIAQEIGARPPRLHVPYHALYAASYVAERAALLSRSRRPPLVTRHGVMLFGTANRHAIDKARRELGFAPEVDLRYGVRLASSWWLRDQARSAGLSPAGYSAEGVAV